MDKMEEGVNKQLITRTRTRTRTAQTNTLKLDLKQELYKLMT